LTAVAGQSEEEGLKRMQQPIESRDLSSFHLFLFDSRQDSSIAQSANMSAELVCERETSTATISLDMISGLFSRWRKSAQKWCDIHRNHIEEVLNFDGFDF
jgi:hypothetical protein